MDDTTRAKPDYDGLFGSASGQAGYFAARQARRFGLTRQLLSHHTGPTGRFLRARRGLYRLRLYPPSPREEVVAAWLAAGPEDAAVSHESALDLLELSDVIPDSVHLTVPRSMRSMRPHPGVTIHTAVVPLRPDEVIRRDGVRLTSPARTILDAAQAGVGPEQVIRAAREAVRRGLATPEELAAGARPRGRRVAELLARALEGGAA